MQAVLISIQPKWCELIASGKKTIEVRKSKPKLEAPFKVYIYETKTPLRWNKAHNAIVGGEGGRVIGEFVCDRVRCEHEVADGIVDLSFEKSSCMNYKDLIAYANGNVLYAWHISDLVIYDEPRESWEFKKPCNHKNDCCTCGRYDYIGHRCYDKITRPPQSWMYVKVEQ